MNTPKVSVSIMAYNHEKFLSQALDSVLAQQTDFEVEIIVGEDASQDGTRDVLEEYAQKFPSITPLYRSGENKIFYQGRPTSRRNLIDLLENRVHGKYVAMLDGDDYWTDTYKLQRQADFLDQNPVICIAAHRTQSIGINKRESAYPDSKNFPSGLYTGKDLIKGNFIPTASVMFRRDPDFVMPAWMYKLPYADWPLHMINASRGNIFLMNEVMAVRREHSGGMWTSMSNEEKICSDLSILYAYRDHAPGKLVSLITKRIQEKELDYSSATVPKHGLKKSLKSRRHWNNAFGLQLGRKTLLKAMIKTIWKSLLKRNRSEATEYRSE